MSNYNNLLAAKNQTIVVLCVALGLSVLAGGFAAVGWMRSPEQLRVHIPPDLTKGAVLRPGDPGRSDVYTFAHYIWQQLYRWESDGAKDYEKQIHALRSYLTPACYQNRLDDAAVRVRRHELQKRARSVSEIPGRGYEGKRVHVQVAQQSWVVYLDLHIQETMMGEPIKNRLVNYPIQVVRFDGDPETNAFGLAVDCLADRPRVIEVQAALQE